MYFEARNLKDIDQICNVLRETRLPYRMQVERIYPKVCIDAEKFYNGVIVRAYMKHTGYTHFQAKAWISILHACVAEREIENKPEFDDETFDIFNVYLYQKGSFIYLNERYYSKMFEDYSGTIYITQKTSKMTSKRRNEFVDEIIQWLDDQDIKIAKNPDYKDELEF